VTFRFGGVTDVYYLHELPEVGDFVTRRMRSGSSSLGR
jgi:hypothetical protein